MQQNACGVAFLGGQHPDSRSRRGEHAVPQNFGRDLRCVDPGLHARRRPRDDNGRCAGKPVWGAVRVGSASVVGRPHPAAGDTLESVGQARNIFAFGPAVDWNDGQPPLPDRRPDVTTDCLPGQNAGPVSGPRRRVPNWRIHAWEPRELTSRRIDDHCDGVLLDRREERAIRVPSTRRSTPTGSSRKGDPAGGE